MSQNVDEGSLDKNHNDSLGLKFNLKTFGGNLKNTKRKTSKQIKSLSVWVLNALSGVH